MRQPPDRPTTSLRGLLGACLVAVFAFGGPARAAIADDLTVFLEALTESEEATSRLDRLVAQDDRLRLLQSLARGDTDAVVDAVLGFAGSRAMDELKRAVPFLGQVFMARNAGLWLSEYVWDRAATRGFETARARLTEVIPREDWPHDWDSYRASGRFDAELFRSFLTHDSMVFTNQVWREHGIDNADHPDAERVLFEAFWNRVLVEDAYEAAGLTGQARTPERLRAWLEDEIAFRQELALMSADSWREHLIFLETLRAQSRDNALRLQAATLAEDARVAPADEAEEAEIAIAIEIEEMEIEMETPALAMALSQPTLADQTPPGETAPPAPPGLDLSHETQVVGETTQHSISISQLGDAPVTAFLSLSPLGAATTGGLGHGSIPDVLPLGIGESWSVEIVVMGDHPGAMLALGQADESPTQLALLPAHDVEEAVPEPPVAQEPDHVEDSEALWVAAPVVYSGHQQRTVRYHNLGGRTYSFDSVNVDVTYTFHLDGELFLAYGAHTLTVLDIRFDESGALSANPVPVPIDAREISLGQVEANEGRVNVRGMVGLYDQLMSELPYIVYNSIVHIGADRITFESSQVLPHASSSSADISFVFEIESTTNLFRVNGE